MAEADRIPSHRSTSSMPVGLLEELTEQATPEIRVHEVARARRRAADRAYDDGAVVAEIASRLLTLSAG